MGRFFVTFLFYLFAFVASAQNISGYWQGVLHITKNDSLTIGMLVDMDDDSLRVVMDSPDQYYMDIATNSSMWEDSTLSWKVSDIGASFSGRLSADGQSIIDIFKQGSAIPIQRRGDTHQGQG